MLKRIAKAAILTMLAGSLQVSFLAPQAQAQTGFLCGFVSVTDPTVEGDVQTGEIDGGPLFSADLDNPGEELAVTATTCTIQVGAQGATHAGANAARVESSPTPAVSYIPPTAISYIAPAGAPVYLCTEVVVNGQVRYFNETGDDATRGWSTSSSSACALAISQEVDPGNGEELDPIICPALVAVLGTDGDIDGIWDCPPYGARS